MTGLNTPRSRVTKLVSPRAANSNNSAIRHFIDPSQPQDPLGQDPELPLDETHSLAFRQIGDFRFVQVIYRQPKPHHRRAFTISQLAPIHQPGLYARGLRAGLHRAWLAFRSARDSVPGPARVNRITSRQPNQPSQSFVTHSLPERASRVIERLFHILTPLLEAAREAMSLAKRIRPLE